MEIGEKCIPTCPWRRFQPIHRLPACRQQQCRLLRSGLRHSRLSMPCCMPSRSRPRMWKAMLRQSNASSASIVVAKLVRIQKPNAVAQTTSCFGRGPFVPNCIANIIRNNTRSSGPNTRAKPDRKWSRFSIKIRSKQWTLTWIWRKTIWLSKFGAQLSIH